MHDATLGLVHQALPPRAGGTAPPHPALLLLHGRGADEQDLLPLAGALDPRLLVLSARAPFPFWSGYYWYDVVENGAPDPLSFSDGLAHLERFVQGAAQRYPLDARRVYLLGFSQGAVMAGSLLLTRSELVAGAILLSGYLPLRGELVPKVEEVRGKPVFVGHGTADTMLPVNLGRQARDFLQQAGADTTYREYPLAHQIGEAELDDIARWLSDRLGPPSPTVAVQG